VQARGQGVRRVEGGQEDRNQRRDRHAPVCVQPPFQVYPPCTRA
jgi:hypothetical protein